MALKWLRVAHLRFWGRSFAVPAAQALPQTRVRRDDVKSWGCKLLGRQACWFFLGLGRQKQRILTYGADGELGGRQKVHYGVILSFDSKHQVLSHPEM